MQIVHQNERKIVCEICEFSFHTKHALRIHMKEVHSNIKDHIC